MTDWLQLSGQAAARVLISMVAAVMFGTTVALQAAAQTLVTGNFDGERQIASIISGSRCTAGFTVSLPLPLGNATDTPGCDPMPVPDSVWVHKVVVNSTGGTAPSLTFNTVTTCSPGAASPGVNRPLALVDGQTTSIGVAVTPGTLCGVKETLPPPISGLEACKGRNATWTVSYSSPVTIVAGAHNLLTVTNTLTCDRVPRIDSVFVHKAILVPPGMPVPPGPFQIQVSCTPAGPNVTMPLTSANQFRRGVAVQPGSSCTFTELTPLPPAPTGCTWNPPNYPNGQVGKIHETVEVVNGLNCVQVDSVWVHKTVVAPAGMPVPVGPFPIMVSCTPSIPTSNVLLGTSTNYRGVVTGTGPLSCTFTELSAAMPRPPAGCSWLAPSYPGGQTGHGGQTVEVVNTLRCGLPDSLWVAKRVVNNTGGPAPSLTFNTITSCSAGAASQALNRPLGLVDGQTASLGVAVTPGTSCSVTETLPPPIVALQACGGRNATWTVSYSPPVTIVAGARNMLSVTNTLACDPVPPLDSVRVHKTVSAPAGKVPPNGPFHVDVVCSQAPTPTHLTLSAPYALTQAAPASAGSTCTVTEVAPFPVVAAPCTLVTTYPNGQAAVPGQTVEIVNTMQCAPPAVCTPPGAIDVSTGHGTWTVDGNTTYVNNPYDNSSSIWIPAASGSDWIENNSNNYSDSRVSAGYYLYRFQFTLPNNITPFTFALSGVFAADNKVDVYLNSFPGGNIVSQCGPGMGCFKVFTPFSANITGFVGGLNTLYFNVYNQTIAAAAKTWSGLDVHASITATCNP